MKAERLLRLLRHPHQTTPEDVASLQDLLLRYPYFQAAHALLAKAAHDQAHTTAGQTIQLAAVYAADRNHLKALLENTPPFSVPEETTTSAPEETTIQAPKEEQAAQTSDSNSTNSYIHTIRQKAKRPVTNKKGLAQLHLIQDFIQKDVQFKPQQAIPAQAFQLDLTQKSTTFHDDLATESLAQILVQQGRLQRALEIYDQLILKFPEKKTYFAAILEKLKSQC